MSARGAFEYELDTNHQKTGRRRKRQFVSYPNPKRPSAPIVPWEFA